MPDVQFEEEDVMMSQASTGGYSPSSEKGLVKIIIKLGLAKNAAQANYVLIGIMVLSLLATFYVISKYVLI